MSGVFTKLNELYAMVCVKRQYSQLKVDLRPEQEDLRFCYDILKDVSRSFAAVIIQLHEELRDAVCIFYLVLRGLDTIEDDMDVAVAEKKQMLPCFHEHLEDLSWAIDGIGKGQERTLLQQFYRVSREYQKLKPVYRAVIADICHKMAVGMCHYLDNVVVTKADYNQYCHYVAGLVGHGLTRLFAQSGLEDPHLADELDTANSMGLFLQKANIIRDYYEDILETPPRIFWPREIWQHYGSSMHSFREAGNEVQALKCLNAMVADALVHIPECIKYLSQLKEPSVFLFCAIPQVMAIATLAQVYNNPRVFYEKVKISKGCACSIIKNSVNLKVALTMFAAFMKNIQAALMEEDPSYDTIAQRLRIGQGLIAEHLQLEASKESLSTSRSFMTHYPALGGQLLHAIIDSISGYFRQ